MYFKLEAIGRSQVVRLPKAAVDACELVLGAPIAIEVRGRTIVLSPALSTRSGWAEATRAGERDDLRRPLPVRNLADDDWTW